MNKKLILPKILFLALFLLIGWCMTHTAKAQKGRMTFSDRLVHPNSRYYGQSDTNYRAKKVYPDPKDIITAYPMALFISRLTAGYEHAFKSNLSAKAILSYGSGNRHGGIFGSYNNKQEFKGFSVEGQGRFYPMKHYLKGLYGGAYLQYKEMTYGTQKQKISATSGGGIIGYQAVAGGVFVLDIYGGGGLMSTSDNSLSDDIMIDPYTNGVVLRVGFAIGFVIR